MGKASRWGGAGGEGVQGVDLARPWGAEPRLARLKFCTNTSVAVMNVIGFKRSVSLLVAWSSRKYRPRKVAFDVLRISQVIP